MNIIISRILLIILKNKKWLMIFHIIIILSVIV